jgi:asparaginyl-tRNA synthetase
MDVLASRIGEIIGGSQREERLEVLDRNMAERGIDREHWAPGLANVRDAIPFPRTPETRGMTRATLAVNS